ncbi:MAG: SNF2-related protein [Bacillota bacterium]
MSRREKDLYGFSFEDRKKEQKEKYQEKLISSLNDKVPPTIYMRGMNYYKNNRVLSCKVSQKSKTEFHLRAKISGTKQYSVKIDLEIDEENILFENQCSCPYDWGDVCKHVVAVLLKFFYEAYPELSEDLLIEKNYKKLLEITDLDKEKKANVLDFKVKGLINENLVNFKLVIGSDKLTGSIIKKLVTYVNRSSYIPDKSFERFLSAEEVALVDKLEELETQKGKTEHSLLLTKNEENFQVLQNIIQKYSVKLMENDKVAKIGETFYPEVRVEGDESQVKFKLNDMKYKIYSDRFDRVHWTVRNNVIHYIDLSIIDKLPGEVAVPEKKRGEFLFEILPALQKKLPLKISSKLKSYELTTIKPEIEVEFDYIEENIYCYPTVKIENDIYKNTEILGFNFEENRYFKAEDNPRTWYGIDYGLMKMLIEFLEENEFKVKPDGFYLENKSNIQQFIINGLSELPEEWEIKTTSSFDEIEVNQIELEPEIKIEDIEDSDNIDWFEFTITYNLGGNSYTRQELREMISYNDAGDPYIQIDNTYFILEKGEKEEKVNDIIDLTTSDSSEEDNYRSKFYNIMYYRQMVEKAGINLSGNKVYNDLQKDITGENLVKKDSIPDRVKPVLRDYQKRGYYWLRFLNKYHFGGILADDMGLGKTLQTLTLIKSIESSSPALVVCPRTLIYNWQEEVNKFFDNMNCLVYYGTPEAREEMIPEFGDYEVIITSYSIISRDFQDFIKENIDFSYCILDEAQHIKNHRTKRAKAVKKIKAQRRLALTGTPLENSVKELWSIFDFLMKGYLGNYSSFRKQYINPIKKENNQEKIQELKEKVAPFILRRKKEEVLKELPEKATTIQTVNMTRLQEDSYQLILDEVKGNIMQTIKEKGFNRSHINILAALTKLRQICDHPGLVLGEKGKKQDSGKMETLLELVEEGINSGRKIIVFSQFVKMLSLIRKKFENKGINFEYLDGSTRNRMERVNKFNQKKEIKAFLISLKAGGTGLNLTGADMVIHVDPWWNPMVERQATDRTHRIGQESKVMVYKLITRGTVEEKMLKLQKRKQNIFDNIIENNKSPLKSLTWEDIKDLLEY